VIVTRHGIGRPGWTCLQMNLPAFDGRAFRRYSSRDWIAQYPLFGDVWRFIVRTENADDVLAEVEAFVSLEVVAC
jgi:hypothetical protein